MFLDKDIRSILTTHPMVSSMFDRVTGPLGPPGT